MQDRSQRIDELLKTAQSTGRRLMLRAVLSRLVLLLPLPLIYAVAGLTYLKVAQPDAEVERLVLLLGALASVLWVAGGIGAALRRRSPLAGALALDVYHGLSDRITNAWSFSQHTERTALMDAAIDDALGRELSPRRAVPIPFPKELWASALLGAAVFGISLLEVQHTRVLPQVVGSFQPMAIAAGDVELLKELAKELQDQTKDPETLAAVRRFNQLVLDVAEQRLDRNQIFQRLDQLERELQKGAELDREGLDEGLKGIADELQKSALTKPAAAALDQKKLADAEEALRKLAERLKEKNPAVDKSELEKLRKALEAASKSSSERLQRLNAQRTELEEERRRLLNKKQKGQPLSKSEEEQLAQNERQLKKLDRKKKQTEQAEQALSQLDKDLAEAARQLMKELGEAGKSLESGAESINRIAKREISDKEKEALKKQMEEMREMLRQAKKGGEKREELLEKFRQLAKGQKPGSGQPGGEEGQGPGKPGQGSPKLSFGSGDGQSIPVPAPGQGPGTEGKQAGAGAGEGGDQAGSGSDPNLRGDQTDLQGKTQDVSAAGVDSGEGTASSEVVYGAAERGFSGAGYRKVYTDYKTVAEEVLETDEIPPGYKFYVRRYFQLIRPRQQPRHQRHAEDKHQEGN